MKGCLWTVQILCLLTVLFLFSIATHDLVVNKWRQITVGRQITVKHGVNWSKKENCQEIFCRSSKALSWCICLLCQFKCMNVLKALMVDWLEQASQIHEMYCHCLEVMNSNPGWVELGMCNASALSHTWTKNIMIQRDDKLSKWQKAIWDEWQEIYGVWVIGLFKMFSWCFSSNKNQLSPSERWDLRQRWLYIHWPNFCLRRLVPNVTRRHKTPIVGNANKINLGLVLLNVYQPVVTHEMGHNSTFKYQVNL